MNKVYNYPFVWECRKIALYTLYTIKAIKSFGFKKASGSAIRYFPVWWKYKQRDLSPLECDRPWITFQAKDFLDTILKKDMSVFEYGSGSSTLYFSRRVKSIYSIENDSEWFTYLERYLSKYEISNVTCKLFEAQPCDDNSFYGSSSPANKGLSFEEYVKSIDAFPDGTFDIIVVDGRSRNACIEHALLKLRKNGYLIVDNSEREGYFKAHDVLFDSSQWEFYSFAGPTPYQFGFSETSFFRKLQ